MPKPKDLSLSNSNYDFYNVLEPILIYLRVKVPPHRIKKKNDKEKQ